MKKLIVFFLMLAIVGCASVHKGRTAKTLGSGEESRLKISSKINGRLSSEYFGMIEFTLENLTGSWVTVDSVEILIPQENVKDEHVNFTTGEDFNVWGQAIRKRNSVQNYNSSLAFGAIVGLSSAASALSDNNKTKRAADSVAVAGTAAYAAKRLGENRNSVEGSPIYPSNHLLNKNHRIPPGLFSESWLLINTANDSLDVMIDELDIKVTYANKKEPEVYRVTLFNSSDSRHLIKWQRSIHKRIK